MYFNSRGLSITAGADYNFVKANVAKGKYYAGIGMRYGLSFYSEEAPMISYTNKWGTGGNVLSLPPGIPDTSWSSHREFAQRFFPE